MTKELLTSSNVITNSDRLLITAYLTDKRVSAGIGDRRSLKLAGTLINFRRYLPLEYEMCTYAAFQEGIVNLYDYGSYTTHKPFSAHAIADYVLISKGFFSWMIENGTGKISFPDLKKRL